MSRFHNCVGAIAAVLVLAACSGAAAQTNLFAEHHQAGDLDLAPYREYHYRDRGAGPMRLVPPLFALFGGSITLAVAHLDILNVELRLTAAQKTRIDAILAKLDADWAWRRHQTRVGRRRESEAQRSDDRADKDINAELSPKLRALGVALLKDLTLLREASLPVERYVELKLTAAQMKSLAQALPVIKQEQSANSHAILDAVRAKDWEAIPVFPLAKS